MGITDIVRKLNSSNDDGSLIVVEGKRDKRSLKILGLTSVKEISGKPLDGFVEKIDPQTVIISCSRGRYDSAFKPALPVRAFYTPIDGAVTLKVTPGGRITVTGFAGQRH